LPWLFWGCMLDRRLLSGRRIGPICGCQLLARDLFD